MAKIISITEHFQHFLAEMKESFWGDVYGQTTVVWKQLLEADSRRQRDRYAVRELYQRRRSLRQPYRNGYYERDFVTRFGAIRLRVARTRGKSFLPCGIEPFAAACQGGGTADPGSIFARHQHAAGGAGSGAVDGRGGERDHGVEADARSGRSGAPVSSGAAQRRLCLSISGRSELAGAAARGGQAGADAGGLRSAARRHASLAGFFAQPGRESGRLGRPARGSVPPRVGGQTTGADRHRRLPGFSGGDSHGLSAGPTSALLGAQDAQSSGGSTEA